MKIAVGQLKESKALLDIRPVNAFVVNRYRQNMRCGHKFPPIVVKKGTSIILSGYHRAAAYLGEYGEDYEVAIIEMPVSNDAEMIEFAVKQNLTHGLQMSSFSKKQAMFKLSELGRTQEQIATLFGISCRRVDIIGDQYVIVRGEPKPIKRGMEHMVGKRMPEKDYEKHKKADIAIDIVREAGQLVQWLKKGYIDLSEQESRGALEQLRDAIDEALAAVCK